MIHDQERARRMYEQMVQRLAELDRVDGINLDPPRVRAGWTRRRSSPLHGRSLGTLALTLVVVLALVWGTGSWRDALNFSGRAPLAAPNHEEQWPPPPPDAQAGRLLPAVPVTTVGPHAFQQRLQDGRPVAYDPCRPLHYVVNPAGMPGPGLQLIREAVAAVSAATGLVLTEDGVTDEPLSTDRSPLQADRYGTVWAPVLIGWSTAAEYPLLGGDIAGVGGSHVLAPSGPGSERLVSGQVGLDAETFERVLAHPGGYDQARAVVMHELAHVVGLGHVDDGGELMSASTSGRTAWGPGDLQGLALAGGGDCHTDT